MKTIKILTILVLSVIALQAQDITNKLGGNTAAETYDVTDSGNNVLFQVKGDGHVWIGSGNTGPNSTLKVFGSDHYALYVENSSYFGGWFNSFGSGGYGLQGSCYGSNSKGVAGYGTQYNFYAVNAGATIDYGSASSIRWKNNIIEIDDPLEKLSKIRGVYFDWDFEHGGRHDVGCIAEEVGNVLPEIVAYDENGVDADGMDYSKLTPLLIEAVKELKEIVEVQQKRIEDLEEK